jgi:hypothetical protein
VFSLQGATGADSSIAPPVISFTGSDSADGLLAVGTLGTNANPVNCGGSATVFFSGTIIPNSVALQVGGEVNCTYDNLPPNAPVSGGDPSVGGVHATVTGNCKVIHSSSVQGGVASTTSEIYLLPPAVWACAGFGPNYLGCNIGPDPVKPFTGNGEPAAVAVGDADATFAQGGVTYPLIFQCYAGFTDPSGAPKASFVGGQCNEA